MRDNGAVGFFATRLFAGLASWLLVCIVPALAQEPAKPSPKPAVLEYAGSVVCQGCHEEISKTFFNRNPHRLLETDAKRPWNEKSCESCHGMGSKHAESASPEDIVNPKKMAAKLADKSCLGCHLQEQTNAGRIHGGHARSEVSCVSCHSIHAPKRAANVMRTELCSTCHLTSAAEFQRPFTHRLRQGAMSCVDCHNPHGSQNRSAFLNTSLNEPGCYKCHGDKRGPFTFEHAPVRQEGCTACHQPHGSANPRMLTRHEVRFQCMECHTNLPSIRADTMSSGAGTLPPAFHDLRNPRIRNCTVCHTKIHGSHVNRAFTR